VALTFDAGSDCGHAGAILDVLKANGITATFGLTGRWVELCPLEAARMGAEGHAVMNHSYSHPSFTGLSTGEGHLSEAQMLDQLDRGEAAIAEATGRSPLPLFRPPYGDYDTAVNAAVGSAGYRYNVLWTIDSGGWKGLDPAVVVSRVLTKLSNGAIVAMHVGSTSTDIGALQDVIDGIRAAGYAFGTVAQIL
jgi:peptidoglycan/xylan/chitin deacetylase (PgdA/CDA1 family)